MNANDRFEILGELYERRFNRLRPGKDESAAAGRGSSDRENVDQFSEWYGEGSQALDDAIERIHQLNERLDNFE